MTDTPSDYAAADELSLRSQLETRKRRIFRMLNTRPVSQDVWDRGSRYSAQLSDALDAEQLDVVEAAQLVAAVDAAIRDGALD